MPECQSCKDDRRSKKLGPVERVLLPVEVTAEGFKKPDELTYVCRHCDGDTLVNGALKAHRERTGG